MKNIFCNFLLLCICNYLFAQTTLTKQGQNYWGGAYVPPTWSKTYKDYSSSSSSKSSSYSSSNYKSNFTVGKSSSFGNATSDKVHLDLARYHYNNDAAQANAIEKARLERIRAEKASKNAKLFFEKLDEAKDLILNQKQYYDGQRILVNDMQEIYQNTKNDYSGFDASNEYLELINEYQDERDYYIYLSQVKVGAYLPSLSYYNYYFANKDKSTTQKLDELMPLTSENYYFMNEGNFIISNEFLKLGKLKLSVEERLKVDLYLVQIFLGLDKKEDAKKALSHIIKFYEPLVPDLSYVADELAFIYFKLDDMDLVQKNIEYYCEYRNTNFYRYWIITSLLDDESWDSKKYPEAIPFFERNLNYMESMKKYSDSSTVSILFGRYWYILYTKKSDNLKTYIEKRKEYYAIVEKDPAFIAYDDEYMVALLRIKDETEINRILLKRKALGENYSKNKIASYQKKLDSYIAEHKGFSVPKDKDYMKSVLEGYWKRYYQIQALPAIDALNYFDDVYLREFYNSGGCKYVTNLFANEIEYLKQFTSDELGSYAERCKCIPVSRKKSRSYPKVFDPKPVQLTWPIKP